MSVVRRPSSANAAERMAGFGALQSLCENRPRTSEGSRPLGSGFLSSNEPCEARGEPVSHLKALRITARELRGVGFDDENDENAPRFGAARDAPWDAPWDPREPPPHANAPVFVPPRDRDPSARRFERKPPPFERPQRPATARAPEPPAATTSLADSKPVTRDPLPLEATTATMPSQRNHRPHQPPSSDVDVKDLNSNATANPCSVGIPTVPVHEVAALVAAAVAGEPPRALASAKGAAAAAMAAVSETVRRAVTDARREGATMGAAEARLALQRSASKAEKAARAAAAAAEASAAEAEAARDEEERKRKAAEAQRDDAMRRAAAAEKNKARKSDVVRRPGSSGSVSDSTEARLVEKNKALRARADAMAAELKALRSAAEREKARADHLELRLAKTEVAKDAETARAAREERAARETVALCERKVAAATETLATERRDAKDARNAYEVLVRDAREAAERACAEAQKNALALAGDARDGARALKADLADARRLMAETGAAVAAGTRRRLAGGLRRATRAEKSAQDARRRLAAAERDARDAESRASDAETRLAELESRAARDREAAERAASMLAAKLEARLEENRAEQEEESARRDEALAEALEAAAAARREAAAASASAEAAGAEAEAAWKAAAQAEREVEEASARRREADARGFAARVRALRGRYFSSGSGEEDVEEDAEDSVARTDFSVSWPKSKKRASRFCSNAVRARLDPSGLVEAMLDFKRRQSESLSASRSLRSCPSARADAEARLELGKLEECVLVTLSGEAMKRASAKGAARARPTSPLAPSPTLTMSDEDVLDLLNL